MDNLFVNNRRALILEQLMKGSVTVADMAKIADVSEITIRRDFDEMEKQGYLKRVHGGAVSVNGRTTVVPYAIRQLKNQAEKCAIARHAATLISNGDSIALDTGTTILNMTDYFNHIETLTLLTTSFFVAAKLINNSKIRIVLPEGVLEGGEGALVGETVVKSLQDYFVDKCFIGVGAIDAAAGLTEHGLQDAQIKKIMISRSRETILLADSSKFNKIAFKQVSSLEQINKIITDKIPSPDICDAIKNANVELHIVSTTTDKVQII